MVDDLIDLKRSDRVNFAYNQASCNELPHVNWIRDEDRLKPGLLRIGVGHHQFPAGNSLGAHRGIKE